MEGEDKRARKDPRSTHLGNPQILWFGPPVPRFLTVSAWPARQRWLIVLAK